MFTSLIEPLQSQQPTLAIVSSAGFNNNNSYCDI